MTQKTILNFVSAIALCLVVGYGGYWYAATAIATWYAALQKLDFTPSQELFIPLWTIFYLLLGISLFLILQSGRKRHDVGHSLILFGCMLLLFIGWVFCFFGLHSTFLGLLMLILAMITLLWTMRLVIRFSLPAVLALVPCLAWVAFITYLNYAILVLNPGYFGLTL